jgi:orotidine-5'-phosphate decarboxylase
MFVDRLINKISEKNNPSVVGLDTILDYVPRYLKEEHFQTHGKNLKGAANAILEFNRQIIDQVSDLVPVVKLQLGCYEMYGIEGMIAFNETVKYAKQKDLLVIADGKRNDIGSSASYYSTAYLGKTSIDEISETVFDVDALTVNPYLGIDGLKPFITDCINFGKGIFILAKTSNKSAGQFQEIVSEHGKSMYEIVAELINECAKLVKGKDGYSSIGAVVGATYPNQARMLRNLMKSSFFLVPGYGAQGGTAADVVHSFDKNGKGAIVNASRSIIGAYQSEHLKDKYDEKDFAKATREEVIRMRDEINNALANHK